MMRWTPLLGLVFLVSATPAWAEKPFAERAADYQFNAGLVYGTLGELCNLRNLKEISEEQFNSRATTYMKQWHGVQYAIDGLTAIREAKPKCYELIRTRVFRVESGASD
ncbi:hypothetical protein [Synechococcus sp. MIT S9451]|uniref:hypothetical protein n=1 Tax=Synechococcus sp. MIT S9451 TaxID=3082543 RepID=UPI0039B47EF2